jgi:adenosine deaminase
MPKLDLHFHFRGGIPIRCVWKLARKYYPQILKGDFYETFDVITDFKSFRKAYDFVTDLIRTEEDLALVSRATASKLRCDGIIYSEVSVSPLSFKGIAPYRVLEIISDAFGKAGVKAGFIGSFERNEAAYEAKFKYEFYRDARALGICGIVLAGDETENPIPVFPKLFEAAKADGLGVTIHAGEYCDEKNIAYAIETLNADRIGHGNNIRDPKLVDEIMRRGVHVEMCPMSNMKLNSAVTPENYDLPRYFREGMSVSINSDDPGIVDASLSDNYELAAMKYSFREPEFRAMLENAAAAAFASKTAKRKLERAFANKTARRKPTRAFAGKETRRKLALSLRARQIHR